MSHHDQSAPHILASLKAKQFLEPSTNEQNQKDLVKTLVLKSTSIHDALNALDLLREWGSDESDFLEKARQRWPEATAFQDVASQANGVGEEKKKQNGK